MKILVTGGAESIGSHLVDALAEKHEVVVLDSLEPQVHAEKPDYLNPNAAYIFGDMRDEAIFHLASAVGVGRSMYEIRRYVEVNTIATTKLPDILVNEENDVKKNS